MPKLATTLEQVAVRLVIDDNAVLKRFSGGKAVQPITTFSIVAHDHSRQEWGVAVQSKFLAVGALVPWARAGVGAVATQSYVNVNYGPDGLEMMAKGRSAAETIEALTMADDQRQLRQVGVVDRNGRAAAFTGEDCYDWAGHIVGNGFACQGNLLIPGTVEAMVETFEARRGKTGELADWLVDALAAGQAAGGDKRGRQSAAVLVVRKGGGYGGGTDRYLDLRVDDDPFPIRKLNSLLNLHHLYFGQVDVDNLIPLSEICINLQEMLARTGYYQGPASGEFDRATRKALRALVGSENLEQRWDGSGDTIDKVVVEYLNERYG